MKISISEVSYEKFFNKKIMIVGNQLINEDSLAERILFDIILAQPYINGSVLANKNKIDDFYLKCGDITTKVNMSSCYKRYTSLLDSRLFKDDVYFVADNISLSDEAIAEITYKMNGKKMMAIFYYPYIVKNVNFDYIIITESTDDILLEEAYEIIRDNYPFDYEGFREIVENFIDSENVVVIKTETKKIKVLGY